MTKTKTQNKTLLPPYAKVPINRCNLPVEVLGDLSFQFNPKWICIDGIAELHKGFFQQLDEESNANLRAQIFVKYMTAHFNLDTLDEAGYDTAITVDRSRANYLKVLRGWFFDSDSLEGAVIKSWTESRFGLVPRYHQEPIRSIDDDAYARFVSQSSRGFYNTNALAAQLDLLYSYCQYELSRRFSKQCTIVLYRGQNNFDSIERIPEEKITTEVISEHHPSKVFLLNNISSFTSDPNRAGEFGDVVISATVPFAKLLFFSGLMPGIMTSEREYAVIGGVYNVDVVMEIRRQ